MPSVTATLGFFFVPVGWLLPRWCGHGTGINLLVRFEVNTSQYLNRIVRVIYSGTREEELLYDVSETSVFWKKSLLNKLLKQVPRHAGQPTAHHHLRPKIPCGNGPHLEPNPTLSESANSQALV